MKCTICARRVIVLLFIIASSTSAVRGAPSYFFQLANTGLVSTLDVNNVSSPVSTYQITGLTAGNRENAAGFDPTSNRLYYVTKSNNNTVTELDYLQLSPQGVVISQNVLGGLAPYVSNSAGADFFNGRMWVSQQLTNVVYGFDPNNLSNAPVVVTLPTPTGYPSTQFNLGDLTFDDAANVMFIAGGLNGSNTTGFRYEYSLANPGNPSLMASRVYAISSTDLFTNGIIFDQSTSQLYGYNNVVGQLYSIDTATLQDSVILGSNPALFNDGDLAGFTSNPISVPEPTSLISHGVVLSLVLICSRIRGRKGVRGRAN